MTTKIEQIMAEAARDYRMENDAKAPWAYPVDEMREILTALDAAGLRVLPKNATEEISEAMDAWVWDHDIIKGAEMWKAGVAAFQSATYEPEPTE